MGRSDFLYEDFRRRMALEPTSCQDSLFRELADFITSDDGDIMVINGYAGTGKTTAISALIASMTEMKVPTVLLAPTGRAAKVLSQFSGRPAYTVHKHIYRQKSVGDDGLGQFSLAYNKSRDTLYIVDEVSLIGIDSLQQGSGAVFGSGNLLEDLVSYVRSGSGCRLVLVGDSAQLPPVGLDCSPALSENFMDAFGGVRFASLTTVVRQHKESGILHNATEVRNLICGAAPDDTFDGLRLRSDGFDDVLRISGGELIDALTDAYSHYGEEETIVLTRSNKRANRYNLGIRSAVQFKEEQLVYGDKLMIVKNCYQFLEENDPLEYIANGDMAYLQSIKGFEERYSLHFADATLRLPDYGDRIIKAKLCLDALSSESSSLSREQQNALYNGVWEDYAHIRGKRKRYQTMREDKYYNALLIKYAQAITCHKSQGGQWKCVFIDNPFWQSEQTLDDLKWLYTALTRAVEKVYLVNFPDRFFV
ncbi:MAG: AAA family ATPase [Candidatus Cryptobacteroides sp.]|nr:AAA family ATPase [Candidatus Cryptobacteroides sp.]